MSKAKARTNGMNFEQVPTVLPIQAIELFSLLWIQHFFFYAPPPGQFSLPFEIKQQFNIELNKRHVALLRKALHTNNDKVRNQNENCVVNFISRSRSLCWDFIDAICSQRDRVHTFYACFSVVLRFFLVFK